MGTDTPKKNNIAVWIIVGILAVIIIRYIYVSNSTSTDISDTNSYISQNSVSPIEQITQQKLDTGSYEIIGTNHAPTVQNFYVLIKFKDLSEQNLQSFIDKFRREFCFGNCNIDLYDTKSVLSLIDKYPLEGSDYVKVADHYIASSSFDSTSVRLYPFQDTLYKEYGGKNWKK